VRGDDPHGGNPLRTNARGDLAHEGALLRPSTGDRHVEWMLIARLSLDATQAENHERCCGANRRMSFRPSSHRWASVPGRRAVYIRAGFRISEGGDASACACTAPDLLT
jgi:hypothetical protein